MSCKTATRVAAEQKLKQILSSIPESILQNDGKNASASARYFRDWFLRQFHGATNECCSLHEFAIYFLNAVRQQTDIHLRIYENESPKEQDVQHGEHSIFMRNLDSPRSELSKSREQSCPKLDDSSSFNISGNSSVTPSTSWHRHVQSNTSTPVRRATNHSSQHRPGSSSANRSSPSNLPNNNEKKARSSSHQSLCLGDFFDLSTANNRSHKKKATQQRHSPADLGNGKPQKRATLTTISLKPSHKIPTLVSSDGSSSVCAFLDSKSDKKTAKTSIEVNKESSSTDSVGAVKSSLNKTVTETSKALPMAVFDQPALQANSIDELTAEVRDPVILSKLALIYALLIDLNFTINVLNEVALLLNLLNANGKQFQNELTTIDTLQGSTGIELLQSRKNCDYFVLRVLSKQRELLALLDKRSLGLVLKSERMACLPQEVNLYLSSIHQHKLQLDVLRLQNSTPIGLDKSLKNVYFQEDTDSRDHFASNNDFAAFKIQRDLFYKILKLWETHHLNTVWSFANEVAPKIREIFVQSENPLNMAHFADLFVSQLLLSASDTTLLEEIGIDMDLQKFSRLRNRLVESSAGGIEYQFPRSQAFFRDFISEVRSMAFMEQLKMALYLKLITLNESTFEQQNLGATNNTNEAEDDNVENSEYTMRPDVLSSMLVLAKFLGLVTAQPFNNRGSICTNLERQQIMLRSLFQPNFDVFRLLQDAIKNGKLLIMLPWLVQYFSMLDDITLQLDMFKQTAQLMFGLYIVLGTRKTKLMPTSTFIIRCCLGWLFDRKPIIAEQFYTYRAAHCQLFTDDDTNIDEFDCLLPKNLSTTLPEQEGAMTSELPSALQFHSMLEAILNVACPLLAEFRFSIMPTKYEKDVSRMGGYRHVTTRFANRPNTNPTISNNVVNPGSLPPSQQKLLEAFLHAQSSSSRVLLQMLIEYIFKATIKDAQCTILQPAKSTADSKVNEITCWDYEKVCNNITAIYSSAHEEAVTQWNSNVPKIIDERIRMSVNALVSKDTAEITKSTYFLIIRHKVSKKVTDLATEENIIGKYFQHNFDDMTQKICKANLKKAQFPQSTTLKIVGTAPSVFKLIDEFQHWLYLTFSHSQQFTNTAPLIEFLASTPLTFENTLPTVFYYLIGEVTVQLLQHIIIRKPNFLTLDVIEAAFKILLNENMLEATANAAKVNDDAECVDECEIKTLKTPNIYDGLITTSLIHSFEGRQICFDKLKQLLIEMKRQSVVSVNFINERFLAIFKEEWSADVLNRISDILRAVAQETVHAARDGAGGGNFSGNTDDDDEMSNLFMEVLADFSRDVDDL